jgi:hypothetical protein
MAGDLRGARSKILSETGTIRKYNLSLFSPDLDKKQ